ncbi:MAG TPA: T9SS type A sorting domain-containing protein [bacterium]|nr:T9SS type A sorting domain-containing protein [bacterium]
MKKTIIMIGLLSLLAAIPPLLFAIGGKISGFIDYQGEKTGPVIIAILAIPPDFDQPLRLDTLASAGSYEISDLADGTYFIGAFLDANGNGFPGMDEPMGIFPAPITVVDSAEIYGIDFEIKQLPTGTGTISGNVSYTGVQTGEVHIYALGLTRTPFTSTHFTWGEADSYILEGLFGGDYIVVAYMDVNQNQLPDPGEPMGAFNKSVKLEDGGSFENGDIILFEPDMYTGSISGNVYYDGPKAGDIHVISGGLSLTPIQDVLADDQTGSYQIPHLAAGSYYLFAYVDADSNGSFSLGEPFSETYLEKVEVSWGEETSGMDLYLTDVGSGAITGEISYYGTKQGLILAAAAGLAATPIMPQAVPKFGPGPYPYMIPGLAPGIYTVLGLIPDFGQGLPSEFDEIIQLVMDSPFGFYLGDFVYVDRDTVNDINFTLEDSSTSSIAGTILSPHGLNGEVFVFCLGISRTPFMKLSIAGSGDYQISGLASGKYIVAAFMDVNGDSTFSIHEPMGFTQKLITVYSNSTTEKVNLNLGLPTTVAAADRPDLPADFALLPNYPNPFNPETRLRFQLPEASHVRLKIFNVRGEEVAALLDQEVQAGYHQIIWNAQSAVGNLSSGVYFCRIESRNFTQSRKMMFIR